MTTRTWEVLSERTSGTFIALVYLVLGLGDLGFSLAAFQLGVPEGNPLLSWLGNHGAFIPAKLALTALAGGLIAALYPRPRARLVCWAGVFLMFLVDAYHVIALMALQGR